MDRATQSDSVSPQAVRVDAPALDFARPVPADGYAWWYLDALSPDGRFGLTVIAFVGSVFSPYYAAARATGPADPLNHCCLNVCLYLPGARRWTMIERGRAAVARTPGQFVIGPSALDWDGVRLRIAFDEQTPSGKSVRGEVVALPGPALRAEFMLDPAARHVWRPLSVDARVEVRLHAPAGVAWSGAGYLDHNFGAAPLERDFRRWTWSRSSADADGLAHVDYDVVLADGTPRTMSLQLSADGARPVTPLTQRRLRPSAWALPRQVHATRAKVVRTFEDTPFYSRSSVRVAGDAGLRTCMHEHLSLTRFAHPLMQWALPYRVKRMAD